MEKEDLLEGHANAGSVRHAGVDDDSEAHVLQLLQPRRRAAGWNEERDRPRCLTSSDHRIEDSCAAGATTSTRPSSLALNAVLPDRALTLPVSKRTFLESYELSKRFNTVRKGGAKTREKPEKPVNGCIAHAGMTCFRDGGDPLTNGTKVLLVYPNISRNERYRGRLGAFGGKQIPLGLFSLAAFLRQQGYRVDAVDAEARGLGPEAVASYAREGRFDAVGISTTTPIFHRAVELARTIKQTIAHVPVIVGGPHVSALPFESLTVCEAFDYAIPHEGEVTLSETLAMIEAEGDPKSVQGLVYRRDGRVVANPSRPYVEDLDTLPFPAYDLIPDLAMYRPAPFNYRKRPVVNVMTSRGCPNECTFCAKATFGRRVRMRSAESVVDEIEMLIKRYGVREIAFVDDTFTLRRERIYEVFEQAGRRGLRFPWSCKTRIDTVDESLLRYMKAQGCWYVALGVESGDERILTEIRKNIRLQDVERVVDLSHRAGLVTKGYFMIGHPGESPATIRATSRLARRLKLDQVAVSLNTPMPGTYQFEHADKYGSLDRSAWEEFNFWRPVFIPAGMTKEELTAQHTYFLRRFYLRPVWLARCAWSLARRPSTLFQVAELVRDLCRLSRPRHVGA